MSAPAALLPYRDLDNNGEVRYAPGINGSHLNESHFSDSDGEPLINSQPPPSDLDEDSMARFTATGRPMPGFKYNNLQALGGDMYSVPQLLPKRYTDDSIIPAIVIDVVPSQKVELEGKKRRSSLFGKLKGGDKKKDDGKGLTKVVYMPRRDYLKHFARGLRGEYIGTEPYKRWTEEELEQEFGKYKPAPTKKVYTRVLF